MPAPVEGRKTIVLSGRIVLNQGYWIQLFIVRPKLKKPTLLKTQAQVDAVGAALAVLLVFAVLNVVDGFEFLYTYTRAHEDLELDELILVCLSAPIPLAWYSYRRAKEVSALAEKTLQIERDLNHARKVESLGALAGSIAHELNNQLQPTQSIAQLMLEKREPGDPDRKKLEMILSGVSRATDTISKILNYAHREPAAAQSCNVEDTLTELDAFLQLSCPGSIRYDLSCEPPIGTVRLSASELENIVVNLFTNAIQAVDQDHGEIIIEATAERSKDRSAPRALIRVKDNGSGIPAEIRERVFDPFVTSKDIGKGTGLGLWQVHHLVVQAGGDVTIDSSPETGTTASLWLPLVD